MFRFKFFLILFVSFFSSRICCVFQPTQTEVNSMFVKLQEIVAKLQMPSICMDLCFKIRDPQYKLSENLYASLMDYGIIDADGYMKIETQMLISYVLKDEKRVQIILAAKKSQAKLK